MKRILRNKDSGNFLERYYKSFRHAVSGIWYALKYEHNMIIILAAIIVTSLAGFYFNIAGGEVCKSIMMAEDIARLIPLLIEKGGVYNVCDTNQPTFGDISESVAKQLGKRKPISIPYWIAWCMAKVGDLLGPKFPFNSYKWAKMTESLTFTNDKARRELAWEPLDVLENYKI